MNCAGCCLEEPGLGGARRASPAAESVPAASAAARFRAQLLHLTLQRRQFSIQGLGLHTIHPPPNQRGSVGTIVSRPAVAFVLTAIGAGKLAEKHPVTTLRSAEEFPQYCVGPWRNRFVGVEVRAYLERGLGRFYADHAREQSQVIDVTCPGRQCLHGEDVLG